jgi:sporulation protein YlmC with PRC-barrel domain
MNTKKVNIKPPETPSEEKAQVQEWANKLEDHMVVAQSEGVLLGDVSNIFIDTKSKRISILELRKGIWGDRKYINVDDILSVGENIIFIKSKDSAVDLDEIDLNFHRNINSLKGMEITSMSGKKVGELEDIDIITSNFEVSEISLDNGQCLPVNLKEVVIGEDEILVPIDYESKIIDKAEIENTSYGKTIINQIARSFQNERNRRGFPKR